MGHLLHLFTVECVLIWQEAIRVALTFFFQDVNSSHMVLYGYTMWYFPVPWERFACYFQELLQQRPIMSCRPKDPRLWQEFLSATMTSKSLAGHPTAHSLCYFFISALASESIRVPCGASASESILQWDQGFVQSEQFRSRKSVRIFQGPCARKCVDSQRVDQVVCWTNY